MTTTKATIWALAFLALVLAPSARAAQAASDWFETEQGKVRLIAAQPYVGDDSTLELGLEFHLAPHWKIYWRSPGDAGYPPRLDWHGSENLATAKIAWPAPTRFSVLGLETTGYEGDVVLPIHARVERAGAPLALRATLDYLTCAEICVPYQAALALSLPAAPEPGAAFGPLIARWEERVPGDGKAAGLALEGAVLRPGSDAALDLVIRSDRPLDAPDAFVEGADHVTFGPPAPEADGPDSTLLRLPVYGPQAALDDLAGKKLQVTLVDGERAMTGAVTPSRGAPALDLGRLLPMLLVALLGGLILNVMPCVLPVLSLKLMGAIEHRDRPLRTVRLGFLATSAGILLSFLALAGALIALGTAGLAAGWGVQFQEPLFLAAMAAVVTLFAANLWGLYDVALPQAVADLGARAALGNVATGAFVTLLATPCSAPFLGTAVGFALASGPGATIVIFLALGVGFAAPYLLVAAVPRLARLLPRPGRWMRFVRPILGVALAGTAGWLVFVLAAESGAQAAVALAAILVAMIAVLWILRARPLRRGAVAALVAAALAVPLVERAPAAPGADALWRSFDPASLGPLVHEGDVVFVDVTADWCLTCKVNERLVLDSADTQKLLTAQRVIAMRADWTRPDPAITAYLKRFGRYGIPFNAVYGPGAPAGLVLPLILTPDAVRAALARAAGGGDGRG